MRFDLTSWIFWGDGCLNELPFPVFNTLNEVHKYFYHVRREYIHLQKTKTYFFSCCEMHKPEKIEETDQGRELGFLMILEPDHFYYFC